MSENKRKSLRLKEKKGKESSLSIGDQFITCNDVGHQHEAHCFDLPVLIRFTPSAAFPHWTNTKQYTIEPLQCVVAVGWRWRCKLEIKWMGVEERN